MRKNTRLLRATLTSAIALLTTTYTSATTPSLPDDLYQHDFTLGGDMMRYRYEEKFDKGVPGIPDGQDWMRLQSWQYGINASYRFTYDKTWWVQAEARVNYGLAQYKHPDSHILNFPNAGEPNLIFEPRLLAGYNLIFTDFTISPYLGLGYRWKQDDSTMINHDGAGKPEDHSETMKLKRLNMLPYVALGTEIKYTFTDKMFIQGRIEYDTTFYGKLFTYDVKSCPSPEEYKQKGWGLRGHLHLGHKFEKVTLTWGPYVNFWKIQRSNIIKYRNWIRTSGGAKLWGPCTSYEPRNTTIEAGVSLSVKF